MARTGISFEQVSAVADAIAASGDNPTIAAVREKLGTGSPNTIHAHLKKWREARPVPAAQHFELPVALQKALAEELQKTASAARAEVEGKLVAALAESDELGRSADLLESENDELVEQLAALQAAHEQLTGKSAQQDADIAALNERIEREQKAAELARVELAKMQLKDEQQAAKIAEQKDEIQGLKAAVQTEQKARTEVEKQAAVNDSKLSAANDALKAEKQRSEALEKQLNAVQADCAKAIADASNLREKLGAASVFEQQFKHAQQELQKLQAALEKARDEISAERVKNATLAGADGTQKGAPVSGGRQEKR